MADARSLHNDSSAARDGQGPDNTDNTQPNLITALNDAGSRIRDSITRSMARIANHEYAPDEDKPSVAMTLSNRRNASNYRGNHDSVTREHTALNEQIHTHYNGVPVYSSSPSGIDPRDVEDHSDIEAGQINQYPDLAALKRLLDTGTPKVIQAGLNAKVGKTSNLPEHRVNEIHHNALENYNKRNHVKAPDLDSKEEQKVPVGVPGLAAPEEKAPVCEAMVSRYDRLSKDEKKELLNYFIAKHRAEYYTVLAHALLGYVGEFFYLYWDLRARIELAESFFPDIPEVVNWTVNGILTVPITEANITYSPFTEANGWMLNKLLTPENSLYNNIAANKLLAACFALFAFGGGYVEVVEIDEFLTDLFGEYGKFVPITVLIYAAIAYYTAYNFNDVVDNYKKWLKSPSLILDTFDLTNGRTISERATGVFVLLQELATLGQRVIQMGYGGFEAGKQQSGMLAAYLLGSMVGIGSLPVALYTRVMATEVLYYNRDISAKVYAQAQAEYDARYRAFALFEEIKLFLTPTLLALVPLALVGYELGHSIADDVQADAIAEEVMATGFAIMITLAAHFGLGLRYAAQRLTVTEIAVASLPKNIGDVIPNRTAQLIATVANLLDQFSRGVNFIKSLKSIFPGTFNFDTRQGFTNIMTALFESLFVSLSAFRYQKGKGERALVALAPTWFGNEITAENIAQLQAPRRVEQAQSAPRIEVVERAEYEEIDRPVRQSICTSLSSYMGRTLFGRSQDTGGLEPVIAQGPRSDDDEKAIVQPQSFSRM